MNVKSHALLLAIFGLNASAFAGTPPPDKLLAADTLAVLTVPDYAHNKAVVSQWPIGQFWSDPAMKPFTEKFGGKVKTDLIAPLEREFGLKFSDYADLAQGQLTLAITQNGWDGKSSQLPGFLFLLDAKGKSDALKTNLTNLKKKWVDSGKSIKTDKIRDVEFTTLMFSPEDLSKTLEKAFPDSNAGNETLEAPKAKKPGKKVEWQIGQSDSLLIMGNSTGDIEKVLIRQSGGTVPSLSEQAAFASSYSARFRDALAYGWINFKGIVDTLLKSAPSENAAPNPMVPRPDKILSALGLNGLDSISFNIKDSSDGSLFDLQLSVPESARRGLFKILAADPKSSEPPPFVPADAVKFTRWRIDLQKAWASVENMIEEVSPQGAVGIKAMIDLAGKDKDPNFDLRKNLIANLGDDFISYEKNPRKQTLGEFSSAPTLYLLSSPKAEQLAAAIKALASLLPQQAKMKEREFLGRKVYTMGLPGGGGKGRGKSSDRSEKTLNYAASGSYVAFSTDAATLEEFLRGNNGKALRETPGLAEAAQKVGGLSTGLFSFQNDSEVTRMLLDTLKNESGTLATLFSNLPMAARLGMDEDSKKFKDWVDFSLLPSFDKISKYFYFTLWTGSADSQGIDIKMFSPNSPQFKK